MKTIKVFSKDGMEWRFDWNEHSWVFTDHCLVVQDTEGVRKLILNFELFAYIEVV